MRGCWHQRGPSALAGSARANGLPTLAVAIFYVALKIRHPARAATFGAGRHISTGATLSIKCGAPHLKREICTSGTVRDEGGNILIYSAGSVIRSLIPSHREPLRSRQHRVFGAALSPGRSRTVVDSDWRLASHGIPSPQCSFRSYSCWTLSQAPATEEVGQVRYCDSYSPFQRH